MSTTETNTCDRCGEHAEDTVACHLCEAAECQDCHYNCGYCWEPICESCQHGCDRCGSNYCEDCLPGEDDLAEFKNWRDEGDERREWERDDIGKICWECLLLWYLRGNHTPAAVIADWEARKRPDWTVKQQYMLLRHLRGLAEEAALQKIIDALPGWFREAAAAKEAAAAEDTEETPEQYFNRKHPHAKCHRCETPVRGDTVVLCGGMGGACETWFCADCHSDGTHDCPCESDADRTAEDTEVAVSGKTSGC